MFSHFKSKVKCDHESRVAASCEYHCSKGKSMDILSFQPHTLIEPFRVKTVTPI